MESRAEHPDAKEIFNLRCRIQYLIIVLMLKTGVIQHELEYEQYAPIFDMMTKGELKVPSDVDYSAIRRQVRGMIGGVGKKG